MANIAHLRISNTNSLPGIEFLASSPVGRSLADRSILTLRPTVAVRGASLLGVPSLQEKLLT